MVESLTLEILRNLENFDSLTLLIYGRMGGCGVLYRRMKSKKELDTCRKKLHFMLLGLLWKTDSPVLLQCFGFVWTHSCSLLASSNPITILISAGIREMDLREHVHVPLLCHYTKQWWALICLDRTAHALEHIHESTVSPFKFSEHCLLLPYFPESWPFRWGQTGEDGCFWHILTC